MKLKHRESEAETHHNDKRFSSDPLGPGGIAKGVECLTDVGFGR